ncbi:serine/threonine/dual specificity protein kinase, catalytic domain-containing protein, partial [Tanacetum coccineum]
MRSRINKIFRMSRVTSKGSAPELVKRETDTLVTCAVDALKHSETLCAITMRYMEIGRSSRIDNEVVQDKRQRDDNDLQDERQDQPKEEAVKPKRCKRVAVDCQRSFLSCLDFLITSSILGDIPGSLLSPAVQLTVSAVVPWETDGESVLREACVARALDYLHTGTGVESRVIHRDVKSSNVLLDEKLAAKIFDFGVSKDRPTMTNVLSRLEVVLARTLRSPQSANDQKRNGLTTLIEKARLLLSTNAP